MKINRPTDKVTIRHYKHIYLQLEALQAWYYCSVVKDLVTRIVFNSQMSSDLGIVVRLLCLDGATSVLLTEIGPNKVLISQKFIFTTSSYTT